MAKKRKVVVVEDSPEVFEGQLRDKLEQCNETELSEICRLMGLDADSTMPKPVLVEMALTGVRPKDAPASEFAKMRRMLMSYIKSRTDLALDPKICKRDCYKHSDFFVLACFNANKDLVLAQEEISKAMRRK